MGTARVGAHRLEPVTSSAEDERPYVSFEVHDPDAVLTRVRLSQEVARPRLGPEFVRFAASEWWQLLLPRPAADRMEYQLEFTYGEGHTELLCDPFNPRRAPGAFGDKSVVEFPEYRAPAWVERSAAQGTVTHHEIKSRALRAAVPVRLWTSAGAAPDEPLPLVVAHDGFEYADFSGLLSLLDVMTAAGRLPPVRAALLQPVDRDEIYSGSAAYGRALALEILPALAEIAPAPHGRRMRIGMGASLGALAMLQVHRKSPASFGALFLQSGSYFRQRFDPQEAGFARFRRISRLVGQVLAADGWAHPIPVVMTCGTAEENLGNNRAMRDALVRQGYDVRLHENRDAHNWTGWRDTFDPHLVDLLARLWA
ncbi:MAG: alpha/beta hydrolase [Actinomycetota bacterium]